MSTAGLLHHLGQEIPSGRGSNESWVAYSSHLVARPPVSSRASRSASGSATPSPSKDRRPAPPRLLHWTVRVSQMIRGEQGEDSETESDGEAQDDAQASPASVLTTAWYSAHFDEARASQLTSQSGETSWQTLELRIRVAWDKGNMDVMAVEAERGRDGTYPSIKLVLGSEEGEEGPGGQSADGPPSEAEQRQKERSGRPSVEVRLERLRGVEEINAASIVSAELVSAYTALKGRTASLVEERDGHRRLLQNNRPHERFREANSSLVNPGRLKRKTHDDEGFEGDDE